MKNFMKDCGRAVLWAAVCTAPSRMELMERLERFEAFENFMEPD